MALPDVIAKRNDLYTKVQAYRDSVIAADGTQAAKFDAVRLAGRDLGNLMAQAKKDDPGLTDADLFSSAELMSQVKIDDIKGILLAAGLDLLVDQFSGTSLDTNLWDIQRDENIGVFTVANDELAIWVDDRTANVGPTAGITSKAAFPVGTTLETRCRGGYTKGPITLAALVQPWFEYSQVSAYLAPWKGISWNASSNRSTSYITWNDENGNQGSVTINLNSSINNTYRIVRVDATTIEFYLNGVLMYTLNRQFANDYKAAFLVSISGQYEQLLVDYATVTKN